MAQAIIASVDQPFQISEHSIRIGISVGIAIYPDDSRQFGELLQQADMALYRSKQAGRHAYRFFAEQMNVHSSERLRLEHRLKEALLRHELELYYQPLVSLPDCRLLGFEALVHWQHPTDGMLLPEHFLPIAEESGLILQIGSFVLEQGCRQLRQWQTGLSPSLRLAVNLFPLQITHSNLALQIAEILRSSRLKADGLELELTEELLQLAIQHARGTLGALHHLGVSLSIDNFGSGYCSLPKLQQLHIGSLKIAPHFIEALEEKGDERLIHAMIDMAHGLGIRTTAEGVCSRRQLDRLAALGCDAAQGGLIGRPLPAKDCGPWLARHQSGLPLLEPPQIGLLSD